MPLSLHSLRAERRQGRSIRRTQALASATDWHAKLNANVDDFYANRVSYDEFTRRNRELWDAIARDGKRDAVNALISRDDKAVGRFARVGAAIVARDGVTGRVLRSYAVGGTPWLLVVTEDGAQLSWPAAETCAAAPVHGRRALHVRQPSELRAGERVVDQHGLHGTVVGPGANGTRVIIQWDDGSTSNLSAVDLGSWGVEKATPMIHSHEATLARTQAPLSMTAPGVRETRARTAGAVVNPPASRTMGAGSWLKPGDRVELVAMPDDPNPVARGTKGTVERSSDVDFGGGDRFTQVSVRWDNGQSLMLSIPPDRVRRI